MLYEFLTGCTPFRRGNEWATRKAIIEDTSEPIAGYKMAGLVILAAEGLQGADAENSVVSSVDHVIPPIFGARDLRLYP